MPHLASNTRRSDPLPRFIVFNNGFAFVVTDRLIPSEDEGAEPQYENGRRGILVGMFPTRETALAEAARLNALSG